MKIVKELLNQSLRSTRSINEMEQLIAKEEFGCSYEELSYDDKEYVTYEAYDRMQED